MYELTDEALNKHSAKVDRNGRFRLKLGRGFVPSSKKLMILVLTENGVGELKSRGKPVVLVLDDKITTINLGMMVIDKKAQ